MTFSWCGSQNLEGPDPAPKPDDLGPGSPPLTCSSGERLPAVLAAARLETRRGVEGVTGVGAHAHRPTRALRLPLCLT